MQDNIYRNILKKAGGYKVPPKRMQGQGHIFLNLYKKNLKQDKKQNIFFLFFTKHQGRGLTIKKSHFLKVTIIPKQKTKINIYLTKAKGDSIHLYKKDMVVKTTPVISDDCSINAEPKEPIELTVNDDPISVDEPVKVNEVEKNKLKNVPHEKPIENSYNQRRYF